MKNRNLKNKVVVITGGGRGIGLATAQACAARGAKIAIGDIDTDLAVEAATKLGGFGGQLDVRDRASFANFLAETEKALGPVDVLVNNAGIMVINAFEDESDAMSDAQIDINLRGVINGCKVGVEIMHERGGQIVNVASLAGVIPLPGSAVYCATKFAVRGLTLSLREEYRDSGISFSTVMPSKVRTELAAGSEKAGRGIPTADPEDVANAVVDAVKKDLAEVTVPRYLRGVPAALAAAPSRAERLFRRVLDDRRMLKNMDRRARAGYNDRISSLSREGKS